MTHKSLIDPKLTDYLRSMVADPDPLMSEINKNATEAETKIIQIAPEQGAFLAMLVSLRRPSRILEVGTYWGYSTLWLASGGRDGTRIDTIEGDTTRAREASRAFEKQPFETKITLFKGSASEILPSLPSHGYDFVFIDGEKKEYLDYLKQCARLVAVGGVIVADNTLHKGRVADPDRFKPSTEVIVKFNRRLIESDDWSTSIVPIGDGMTVAVRLR